MSTPKSPISPVGSPLTESNSNEMARLTIALANRANYGTKTAGGNPRIYNCKMCQRAFTREEHLTRHTLSTHNKLKPFTCGLCSRPFSRRDLLLRHAKNLHQGSELAVSRIRKSYKREHDSQQQQRSQSISDEEGGSTGRFNISFENKNYKTDSMISVTPVKSSDSSCSIMSDASTSTTTTSNATTTVVSTPPTTIVTKVKKSFDDFDTPEKKRLKMSVNMLVS